MFFSFDKMHVLGEISGLLLVKTPTDWYTDEDMQLCLVRTKMNRTLL